MGVYEISDLLAKRRDADLLYLEFFKAPAMSLGVSELTAGSVDPQRPHTEDEVYYVVGGRGSISIGADECEVRQGSVIFVAAGVKHRFHSITEVLTLLVVFAPARGSRN